MCLLTYPIVTYGLLQLMLFCCLIYVSIIETFLFTGMYEKHYRKYISFVCPWSYISEPVKQTKVSDYCLLWSICLTEYTSYSVSYLNWNTDNRKCSQYMNGTLCGRKLSDIFCRIRYAQQLAVPCDGICQR